MSSPLVYIPDAALHAHLSHGFHSGMDEYTNTNNWTVTASDSGSATLTSAVGGTLVLAASDGSTGDNDETYLERPSECFLFAENKPITFQSIQQYAEQGTDDANVFVGLFDAPAANMLVDDGAGIKTSGSGFGFFKVDGETEWSVFASKSSTQTKVLLSAANSRTSRVVTAGGSSAQKLRAEFAPTASDRAHFNFYVDAVHVYTISDFDYSSGTEMCVAFGIKGGSGSNAETLNLHDTWCYQRR